MLSMRGLRGDNPLMTPASPIRLPPQKTLFSGRPDAFPWLRFRQPFQRRLGTKWGSSNITIVNFCRATAIVERGVLIPVSPISLPGHMPPSKPATSELARYPANKNISVTANRSRRERRVLWVTPMPWGRLFRLTFLYIFISFRLFIYCHSYPFIPFPSIPSFLPYSSSIKSLNSSLK